MSGGRREASTRRGRTAHRTPSTAARRWPTGSTCETRCLSPQPGWRLLVLARSTARRHQSPSSGRTRPRTRSTCGRSRLTLRSARPRRPVAQRTGRCHPLRCSPSRARCRRSTVHKRGPLRPTPKPGWPLRPARVSRTARDRCCRSPSTAARLIPRGSTCSTHPTTLTPATMRRLAGPAPGRRRHSPSKSRHHYSKASMCETHPQTPKLDREPPRRAPCTARGRTCRIPSTPASRSWIRRTQTRVQPRRTRTQQRLTRERSVRRPGCCPPSSRPRLPSTRGTRRHTPP